MGILEQVADLENRKLASIKNQQEIINRATKACRDFTADEQIRVAELTAEVESIRAEQLRYSGPPGSAFYAGFENRQTRGGSAKEIISYIMETRKSGSFTDNYRYDPYGVGLRDSFNHYIKFGLGALSPESFRALQKDDDIHGGMLVAPYDVAPLWAHGFDNECFVRRLATYRMLEAAQSLRIPKLEADLGDLEWTAEIRTGSTDNQLQTSAVDLHPHPLARRILVSNDLLANPTAKADTLAIDRMTSVCGMVMENGYLNGTGNNQPMGVFSASDAGISTARDCSTGNTATSVKADNLIECRGMLKAQFRKKAVWIFSRAAETMIRKLKDANGDYLWTQGLGGNPNQILGHDVYVSEYVPNTFTASSYVGIFGDFSHYWVVDSIQMRIQRLSELYAETNQTGFIIRVATDGAPVLEDAFVRVKLAAS